MSGTDLVLTERAEVRQAMTDNSAADGGQAVLMQETGYSRNLRRFRGIGPVRAPASAEQIGRYRASDPNIAN